VKVRTSTPVIRPVKPIRKYVLMGEVETVPFTTTISLEQVNSHAAPLRTYGPYLFEKAFGAPFKRLPGLLRPPKRPVLRNSGLQMIRHELDIHRPMPQADLFAVHHKRFEILSTDNKPLTDLLLLPLSRCPKELTQLRWHAASADFTFQLRLLPFRELTQRSAGFTVHRQPVRTKHFSHHLDSQV